MSFATTLQGISPFGPIFGKELRTTARRKRTYFLRVVYMALLLLILLWVFIATSNMGRYGGGVAAQNQARSELGQIFFACFGFFSVFIIGLLGPVMTATAISSERLHKTLPVLLMTPITAWQIVAGKLFSRLLVSLTLIGLGLPVLALVRLLGGVELEQVIGVIALALVAAISSAAIGLFFSTLLNRAYAVILLSFATMLFLYLFVPFVIVMTSAAMHRRGGPPMGAIEFVCALNPYWMVFPAVIPNVWGRMMGTLPWAWCIGSHLALTAGLMMWSALILRRRARKEGEASGGAGDPNANIAIPVAAVTPPPIIATTGVADPNAPVQPPAIPLGYARALPLRKSRPPRDVADNPILWREIRRPLMARRWQRITGISICLVMLAIVYALIGANRGLDESDGQSAWACIFNFLIAGIVLVISSTAIAQEKESDTWTLLLATPVSGRTIVWGKALGIARRLLWPMALVTGHFLLFAVCQVISFSAAFTAIWIMVSFNSIWIATGVYFSLRFSKTTFAVVANLMLAIGAYLLVWAALGLANDIDYVGYNGYSYSAAIDPRWARAGANLVFCLACGWFLFALFQAVWKKRGALGHLMIASLGFFGGLAIFSAKMDWIPTGHLYEQVGWYVPYYFLANIGRHGIGDLEFWLPGFVSQVSGASAVALIIVIGIMHLVLSWFVLSMTAWKFSALVGRAPQSKPLNSAFAVVSGKRPISVAAR